MKVLVVGLSPALDQVNVLQEEVVEEGKIYKTLRRYRTAGSKSLNVARFLSRLGHEVEVLGFFGAYIGHWLISECEKCHIGVHPISCADDNRINVTVLSDGKEYVLSDRPQEISFQELSEFFSTYDSLVKDFPYVVFAGSVAEGVGALDYWRMVNRAAAIGVRTIIDAKPEFARAVESDAWLIKVNQFEAKGLDLDKVRGHLGITCEKSGAVFRTKEMQWIRASVPYVRCVNSVGAGDVFLSYLLDSYWRTANWKEAIKIASAAASSSVSTESIGAVNEELLNHLMQNVVITEGVDTSGSCDGKFYGRLC